MTYSELGEMLRAEREKLHLSIEDAANELKINVRQLQALEEGNVDLLPHPAYTKGFIRSYASWLGISNDEILGELSSLGLADKKVPLNNEEKIETGVNRKKFSFFPIFILILALILYIGWEKGALDFFNNINISKLKSSPVLQSAEEFIASKEETKIETPSEREVSKPEKAKEELSENVILSATQKMPMDSENQENNITNHSESVTTIDANKSDEETNGVSAKNPEEIANVSGQNKLIIMATEECWIHSNADKTDTRQFSLRKGDTFALTFAKSLELKLGNAGGVRLRYNGEDLPAPGTSGQVKTLTFPPNNPHE